MDQAQCDLCRGWYDDLLLHLVLVHDVQDVTDFQGRRSDRDRQDSEAKAYHRYLEELQRLRDSDEITAEEYRKRSDDWMRSHHKE